MKIVSTNDFNTVCKTFQELLFDHNKTIKTTRVKELLAHTFGYKSANGLIHSIPVSFIVNDKTSQILQEQLTTKFQCGDINASDLLQRLGQRLMNTPFPYKKLPNTDYKVFYDALLECDKNPLLGKGTGYMKEEVPILSIYKSSKIVLPSIVQDISEFQESHAGNFTGLRFLLPSSICLKDLHKFLYSDEFIENLNVIDKNFYISKPGDGLKTPTLNQTGMMAKQAIDNLLVEQFGEIHSELYKDFYQPILNKMYKNDPVIEMI